ncbi:hypothetical protein EYF80_050370 [Liparis tanakae]|uniref:Uncharacterized protein n=1 Tax=Liparis tanakae TaxID=230148 RepID=A0A4Z2FEZ8_9TELE|nr:hypothetical protein EYF80_050370 [Liparis tanakae]
MPRLNGSLRLRRPAAGSTHRPAGRSARRLAKTEDGVKDGADSSTAATDLYVWDDQQVRYPGSVVYEAVPVEHVYGSVEAQP